MKTKKALTIWELLLAIAIFAILAIIVIPMFLRDSKAREDAMNKYLNVSFPYNGYEVMVMQTSGPTAAPQITITDGKNFVFATTSIEGREEILWTQPFINFDRSNCDPNSPLYDDCIWGYFEKLREQAYAFNKIKKIFGSINEELILGTLRENSNTPAGKASK